MMNTTFAHKLAMKRRHEIRENNRAVKKAILAIEKQLSDLRIEEEFYERINAAYEDGYSSTGLTGGKFAFYIILSAVSGLIVMRLVLHFMGLAG